ncbi:MAG: glycosyltransferase family 2 protein [Planctomycetota bacterium]
MSTDLTIIIVNWNTCALLDACLTSIERHAADLSLQVIVVDNDSDDDSTSMVRRDHPQVELIENDSNRGFGVANNQAMQRARGELILLLNSDTEVCPGTLRESVRYMRLHRPVGVLGVRAHHPDGSLQLTCFAEPSLLNVALQVLALHRVPWPRFFGRDRMRDWRRDSERDVDVVTGCYFLLRPDVLGDVGLFDEQFFFYGEETDWCRRIRHAGWSTRFAPVGEIIHHGGASAAMLDATRGLLLADGIIRFQRVHHGDLRARATWLLLWLGNAMRAIGYGLRSLLPGQRDARTTSARFARIACSFATAWPSDATPDVPTWTPATSHATAQRAA